uniref:Acyltransferase family protein n=1 Tax=Nocardioides dokdonensis FR1436 TaxID=1300347 RepID=A0A1A9GKG0_9ACTN|nr:acyltransferase [Nocardioides dokdonensis]ANH37945.1 Acyltransferase family protein [Nocardioides dokdonensis FR1436]
MSAALSPPPDRTPDQTADQRRARWPRKARRTDHGFGRVSARPGARSAFRLRGVEGWRGIACLVVVAYHVWQNMDDDGDGLGPAGGSADVLAAILSVDVVVDLFFVLSGLLLFLPFVQAALEDERRVPLWREFLWRRCVRLFPVYWLVVVIAWSTRNFGFETAQWLDLVEHLLLLQAFDSERIFYTLGPAWTLSVEWVFYLSLAALGPPLVRWARTGGTRPARVLMLLAPLGVVALLSVLYKINVQLVWQVPVTDWAWRFGPAAKADDFAIGMALAVLMVVLGERRLPVPGTVLLAVTGAWLILAARVQVLSDPDSMLVILRHPLAATGWALVLLAVMSSRSDRPAAWVDNALLVRLSIVAYTVYIVHEPLILGLRSLDLLPTGTSHLPRNMVVVLLLTLAAAWLLHRVVEEPWCDLAALQRRGGGRADLYAPLDELVPLAADERGPGAVDALSLRDQVLAGHGQDRPVLSRTAPL